MDARFERGEPCFGRKLLRTFVLGFLRAKLASGGV